MKVVTQFIWSLDYTKQCISIKDNIAFKTNNAICYIGYSHFYGELIIMMSYHTLNKRALLLLERAICETKVYIEDIYQLGVSENNQHLVSQASRYLSNLQDLEIWIKVKGNKN